MRTYSLAPHDSSIRHSTETSVPWCLQLAESPTNSPACSIVCYSARLGQTNLFLLMELLLNPMRGPYVTISTNFTCVILFALLLIINVLSVAKLLDWHVENMSFGKLNKWVYEYRYNVVKKKKE